MVLAGENQDGIDDCDTNALMEHRKDFQALSD